MTFELNADTIFRNNYLCGLKAVRNRDVLSELARGHHSSKLKGLPLNQNKNDLYLGPERRIKALCTQH